MYDATEDEIQKLRKTLRRYESTMESKQLDLGAYKTSLSRLEDKYNDVVAHLDEANNEILERESGVKGVTSAIFDLRAQIDPLNGELAAATTKAEAERDRIQLLFNDLTGSVQLTQRDRDDSRAEVERLRAVEAARDSEISDRIDEWIMSLLLS